MQQTADLVVTVSARANGKGSRDERRRRRFEKRRAVQHAGDASGGMAGALGRVGRGCVPCRPFCFGPAPRRFALLARLPGLCIERGQLLSSCSQSPWTRAVAETLWVLASAAKSQHRAQHGSAWTGGRRHRAVLRTTPTTTSTRPARRSGFARFLQTGCLAMYRVCLDRHERARPVGDDGRRPLTRTNLPCFLLQHPSRPSKLAGI
jgi:hypothetical protein